MLNKLQSSFKKYKGELIYTSAGFYQPVVRLVSSFIVAAFVLPEMFGIIQAVALIGSYIAFLHFGVFNGLNRNLAFYKAQGQNEKVQHMVNASFQVSKWVSYLGLVTGISVTFYFLWSGRDLIYILSALSLTIVLFFTPRNLHYDTTYRSGQDFQKLGQILIKQSTLFASVSGLSYFLGYIGKILADVVNSISGFILRYRSQPIKPNAAGSKQDIVELAHVGFPLLLGGYFLSLFKVADQSIIALRLGTEDLGFYTISKLILLAVPVIPTTLGVLLYPRAAAQYGKTKNNKGLRPFFYKALLFNVIVVIPLCIVLYFLTPVIVHTFLPKYEAGIEAARINLLTCMTFVCYGPSIIIGVVRRNTPYVIFTGIILGLFWLVGLYITQGDSSIEDIAYLRFWFSLTLAIFTLGFSYYLTTLHDFRI